jgi:hypothetical protein
MSDRDGHFHHQGVAVFSFKGMSWELLLWDVRELRRYLLPHIDAHRKHFGFEVGPKQEKAVGFLDNLMGNASEVDVSMVAKEFAPVLAPGEQIEKAYQVFRDSFLFTNRRLILVDKQGVSGKKMEYHSIPYRHITHFSIETAGSFDYDAELKIWIAGGDVIMKQFNKKLSIYELQSVLAAYVLE